MTDVCLIRSVDQNQRYLNYFLHSTAMANQLAMLLVGSTFDRINVAEVKSLLIAVPPRAEQDSIAEHLDSELGEFNQAVALAEREIILLREYRTRLIADVVTGKLDARAVAATLPEINTDEPLDDTVLDEGSGSKDDLDDAVEHAAMSFDE